MDQISSNSEVKIRKFNPNTDAKSLTEVWVKGLDQTSNAKWWFQRQWWKDMFVRYAAKATSEDGDMGPEGANLAKHWCTDEGNRCMLIAELVSKEETNPPLLVGCCGIVRGTSLSAEDIDKTETRFSIWKMSVDEKIQGKGVGGKLMKAAEVWAKDNGCLKLRMITANPVASYFYQKHGYEWTEWTWMEWIAFRYLGGHMPTGKWHEKEL